MQEVVRIEEEKELSRDLLQTDVPCIGQSAIRFVYDFESVVSRSIFLSDAAAIVCAVVIHKDGFPVLVCLGEDAVQGASQIFLHIVYRYDNGNLDDVVFIQVSVHLYHLLCDQSQSSGWRRMVCASKRQ